MDRNVNIVTDLNGNKIVLIRHDADGKMYLYDIMDIKKETSNPFEP